MAIELEHELPDYQLPNPTRRTCFTVRREMQPRSPTLLHSQRRYNFFFAEAASQPPSHRNSTRYAGTSLQHHGPKKIKHRLMHWNQKINLQLKWKQGVGYYSYDYYGRRARNLLVRNKGDTCTFIVIYHIYEMSAWHLHQHRPNRSRTLVILRKVVFAANASVAQEQGLYLGETQTIPRRCHERRVSCQG
jgi:hypothetical protein